MKMLSKKAIALFFLAALAPFLLIAGCAQLQQEKPQANPAGQKVVFTIKYPGSGVQTIEKRSGAGAGTNLFDAMRAADVPMKYSEYSFGKMITSVGIIGPAEGEYLAIYVNGNYSEKGASDIVPAEGDMVEFRMEKIQ